MKSYKSGRNLANSTISEETSTKSADGAKSGDIEAKQGIKYSEKHKNDKKTFISKVRDNDADVSNSDCIGMYQGILGPNERKDVPGYVMRYPYKVNPYYLTQAETKLLQELRKYFDARVEFGVKSRLADILDIDEKVLE